MFIIHLCLHVHLNILIVHFDNVVEKKEKETDKVQLKIQFKLNGS